MESIRPNHPLRRLFTGLVEQAFCTEVGMCDPALTDYLVELLIDFTHMDRLNAIRNAQGKKLEHIATMLAILSEADLSNETDRDRAMYRSIGDYSLFWAGVYPEQLKRAVPDPSDVLLSHVTRGKRSYAIVSQLAGEDDAPPSSLFRHLSEEFEVCLMGLGLVRREWERTQQSPFSSRGGLVF